MKKIELKQATRPLSEYMDLVRGEPLVVTVDGEPVAVLVGVEGMDLESLSLGTDPDFLDVIEQSRRRMWDEGGRSPEEIRRALGLIS